MRIRQASLLLAIAGVWGGSMCAQDYDALFPLDVSIGQRLVITFSAPASISPDADTLITSSAGAEGNPQWADTFDFELFNGDEPLGGFTSENPIGPDLLFTDDGRSIAPAMLTSAGSLEVHSGAVVDFSSIRDGSIDGRLVVTPRVDAPGESRVTIYDSIRLAAGPSLPERAEPRAHVPHLDPAARSELVMIDAFVVPTPTASALAAMACVGALGRRRR